jgi:hypothetical protein
MLISCVAYQDGTKVGDISAAQIAEYLHRPMFAGPNYIVTVRSRAQKGLPEVRARWTALNGGFSRRKACRATILKRYMRSSSA